MNVTNDEFVICKICNKKLQKVDGRHLRHCSNGQIKIKDYIKMFPNTPTVTRKQKEIETERAKSAGLKSKESVKKLKIVNCIHCNTELEIPNNYSNTQACESCINKGLSDPDKRKSNQAKIKRENTYLEKYGVKNARHIPGVNDKIIKTQNEKYGGIGFSSESLREKTITSIQSKYNTDNYMKTDEAKKLFSKPRNEETKTKISEGLKGKKSDFKGKNYDEIYGKEKSIELRNKKSKKLKDDFINRLLNNRLNEMNLELMDSEYTDNDKSHLFKCKLCQIEFESSYNELIENEFICIFCENRNPKFRSKGDE